MSKAAGTLWVDLTDLFNWKGTFTGIQNVVDRYTQLYMERDDVHFFIFLPHEQRYIEVDKDEWQARRHTILHPPKAAKAGAIKPVKPPLQRRVYLRLRHYGMTAARRLTPVTVKRAARARLNAYRDYKRSQVGRYPFAAGDTVLVIGGNWGDDYHGFAEGLAKIRRTEKIRLLHVVHDFLPLTYPNYFAPSGSYKRYFTAIAKAADGFLVVSKATKHDLQQFLQTLPGEAARTPISTFRLGEDFGEATPQKPPLPLDDSFILCVGTVEGRKNHALLYSAVKLALQKGVAIPQIVIAGRRGWMAEETLRNLEFDPDVQGRILVSHTIDDNQKAWLFSHCLFSVYPSFCEGWGLPVVESLYNGKLCLTSNTSSLPEAGGKYAAYFSPYDAGELLELISRYSKKSNRTAAEKYIQGRPQYTWRDSFEDFWPKVDHLQKS